MEEVQREYERAHQERLIALEKAWIKALEDEADDEEEKRLLFQEEKRKQGLHLKFKSASSNVESNKAHIGRLRVAHAAEVAVGGSRVAEYAEAITAYEGFIARDEKDAMSLSDLMGKMETVSLKSEEPESLKKDVDDWLKPPTQGFRLGPGRSDKSTKVTVVDTNLSDPAQVEEMSAAFGTGIATVTSADGEQKRIRGTPATREEQELGKHAGWTLSVAAAEDEVRKCVEELEDAEAKKKQCANSADSAASAQEIRRLKAKQQGAENALHQLLDARLL